MKKFLVIVGILCCLFFSLSSCGSGDTASEGDMEEATETMDQAEEAVDELRNRQRKWLERLKKPRMK